MPDLIHIGLFGSGFISCIHAQALTQVPQARIVAAASPTEDHAQAFAAKHSIPHSYKDYRDILDRKDIDIVIIGAPNDLHAQMVIDAAQAGKHIICEKPLCRTLEEAERMLEACERAGVKLMYAEELCFAPKYVRLKQLVDEGALGEIHLVKQSEKHDGPHSPWFWNAERSGGGVMLDMGCHGIEFARWMLNKATITGVYCDLNRTVHIEKTQGDDEGILILTFENGARAYIEESWAKLGGMDDRAEVHGSEGVAYANLLQGNSIQTYSKQGYGYAVEKAGSTAGWSFTIYEELWNYGFPQEMQHFVDCIRLGQEPLETGEDGLRVMEILHAAYESAATGKRVKPPMVVDSMLPIERWKNL